MGEQEKILIMINRWGYLKIEQIALLVNKKENITYKFIMKLVSNKFLNVDTLPKKNYYTLTSKAQSHLRREHKKILK